jgi:hypothetical protein
MPRTRFRPDLDYVVLGPVGRFTKAQQSAVAMADDLLETTSMRTPGGHMVACLPIEAIEGIGRWRWLAVSLSQPEVVGTLGWRTAAANWTPSLLAGSVRVITEQRWRELISGGSVPR